MQVQFISSVAVITPDPRVSRRLYVDAMRLPLIEEADHYQHTENLEGSRSFGVRPSDVVQACVGGCAARSEAGISPGHALDVVGVVLSTLSSPLRVRVAPLFDRRGSERSCGRLRVAARRRWPGSSGAVCVIRYRAASVGLSRTS